MRRLTPWIVLIAILVTGLPALAQSGDDAESYTMGKNIRVILRTGDIGEDGTKVNREWTMMARDRGRPASMLMGWRTPIPTATTVGEDPDAQPMTSYSYQNIGMSAQVETVILPNGKVLLVGQFELSGGRDQPPTEATETDDLPVIGTFQQSLNVILEPGKPVRVAEVPDHDGGTLFLELIAMVED